MSSLRPRGRVTLIGSALASALLGSVAFVASTFGVGSDSLPNLRAELPNSTASYVDFTVDGRPLYRFDTVIRNAGTGAFEAYRNSAGRLYQVVYGVGGPNPGLPNSLPNASVAPASPGSNNVNQWIDLTARAAQTDWAADNHNHWHVQQAARYELRTSGGSLLASAAKVGFCMYDSYGGTWYDGYSSQSDNWCQHRLSDGSGGPSAGIVRMGISPNGGGDLYGADLTYQWVNLAGIAPGTHNVVATIDPNNFIDESSNTDNTTTQARTIPGVVAAGATASAASGSATTITVPEAAFVGPGVLVKTSANPARAYTPGELTGGAAYSLVSQPGHGTAARIGGQRDVVYTPTSGYTGSDSFTYRVTDTRGFVSAVATVSITVGSSPGVSVTVTPSTASMATGVTQQFTATVAGAAAGVTWAVDGTSGGSAANGTISAAGLYTAPSTAGSHTIRATSTAAPAVSASAAVTVTTLPGTGNNNAVASPTLITTLPFNNQISTVAYTAEASDLNTCVGRAGQTAWYRYTPTVAGAVTFSTIGSNYDTVLTLHPGSPGTAASACVDDSNGTTQSILAATLQANTTYWLMVGSYLARPAGNLILNVTGPAGPPAASVSVSPTVASLLTGASQTFTATLIGTSGSVGWSVDGVDGGNTTVGPITSAGVYTAPATAGAHTIRATSITTPAASGTAAVTVTATPPPPPPPGGSNDGAASAAVIGSLPFNASLSTAAYGAETGDPTTCVGATGQTAWYRYTPASTQQVTFSTIGSAYDTVLTLHTGGPGAFSAAIACVDDSNGTQQSVLSATLTAGTSYWLMVGSYQARPAGNLVVSVTTPAAPPPGPTNIDQIANATAVTAVPFAGSYSVAGYTGTGDPAACIGSGTRSAWIRYTPATSRTATISTARSDYDTVLAVYSGSAAALTRIACNDDFNNTTQSQVGVALTGGQSYWIEVSDFRTVAASALRIAIS